MKNGNNESFFSLPGFGSYLSELNKESDKGNLFPESDSEDIHAWARFIPGIVTLARRAGKKVTFVQKCSPCCWHWIMPDGSRIYHFERAAFEQIAAANGHKWEGEFHGKAGKCPTCGNEHTGGGAVPA